MMPLYSARLRTFMRILCMLLAALLLLSACNSPEKTPDDEKTPDGDTPGAPDSASEAPYNLRVNLLQDAFGVDRTALRFSWAMGKSADNCKQAAYRIVIATSAERMTKGETLVDTDWVVSAENTAVEIKDLDKKLSDNALYYWAVQTRDEGGKESLLSTPVPFSTAVGSKWASTNGIWALSGNGGIPAPTSDDWSDYTTDIEFIIDANALGITVRAKDTANFYMWQFKVDGGKAMLYPHVFKGGSFVGNKAIASVEVPEKVAFGIGDTIRARIVCDGDTVTTYLADANDDYIRIDERDMSEYGFDKGIIGMRTGGSEYGRVASIRVYNNGDEDSVLYTSAFDKGANPFNRCTLADGMLVVPKALSTTNMIDTSLIGEIGSDGKSADDFVFLRTVLNLSEEQISRLDRALLSVTALSPEGARQYVYNMYVNGKCVGVGPARLGTTADGKTVLNYNTYDITDALTAGKNAIAAINYATTGHLFLSQLTLHYSDGTREVVSNSARDAAQWRSLEGDAAFGKNNSIGTKYYTAHANNIDMNLYPVGFDTAAYNDGAWGEAYVGDKMDATMLLLPAQTDPISRYESKAETVKVKKLSDGSYVVDLGAEIVGGIRLSADLPSPATLTVYYGEQLNEDGSVMHKMLSTNDYTETWKLVKGMQTVSTIDLLTYRYVQIVGCPIEITPDMVRGLEIRAAFSESATTFTSDNDLLNDIFAMMKHTVRVTTQDLYVDSQSRERLAYEGDLIINLLAAHAFEDDYSIGRATAEYLYTHRTWPAEYYLYAAIFAYDDYMATGDATSLAAYYDVLNKRNYTDKINAEYELLTTNNTKSSSTDAVLVDWPAGERDGYDMNATYNTVLNAVAVGAYESMAKIATVLGKTQDATTYQKLADDLKDAMIDYLYDIDMGAFADGLNEDGSVSAHFSQHATAFALAFGVYNSQKMADRLAATIDEQGKIKMSVYGAYFLLKGLYDSGNGDIANKLLLDEDISEEARTWAKMLYTLNATITTEAWGPAYKNNMTFSHPWGAAPAYAIKNGIFGIHPTSAGYDTFDVRLQTAGIGEAALTVPTLKGAISVSFKNGADGFDATLTVPANTVATVYLPAGENAALTVESETATGNYADGFISVTLGAGEWTLNVK